MPLKQKEVNTGLYSHMGYSPGLTQVDYLKKKKKKHEHTIAAFPLKETECVALRLKLYKDLC